MGPHEGVNCFSSFLHPSLFTLHMQQFQKSTLIFVDLWFLHFDVPWFLSLSSLPVVIFCLHYLHTSSQSIVCPFVLLCSVKALSLWIFLHLTSAWNFLVLTIPCRKIQREIALAEQSMATGHAIDWEDVKIMETEDNRKRRKTAESCMQTHDDCRGSQRLYGCLTVRHFTSHYDWSLNL